MKHEWRKHEKGIYLPEKKPELVDIPEYSFFTIEGKGNPNSDYFAQHIGVLYSVAYAVRMSSKSGIAPDGYNEYTVYPLEGVWDINDQTKNNHDGKLDKDNLIFNLMIRQPNFVTPEFADMIIQRTKQKKPHKLLDNVKFKSFHEGKCVQMMHLGSYDDEPESFRLMQAYCDENNLERKRKSHREIYLNGARKVEAEKLKTVLRFEVTQ